MQIEHQHILSAIEILKRANLRPSTLDKVVRSLEIDEAQKSIVLILINGFSDYFPIDLVVD